MRWIEALWNLPDVIKGENGSVCSFNAVAMLMLVAVKPHTVGWKTEFCVCFVIILSKKFHFHILQFREESGTSCNIECELINRIKSSQGFGYERWRVQWRHWSLACICEPHRLKSNAFGQTFAYSYYMERHFQSDYPYVPQKAVV